jgi:SAM-dependent MidA family methyltransferase
MAIDATLPQPDTAAAAHSARVVEHVRAEIAAAGGFISLARYIELALYAPSLGYYVAGARKFGPDGDYVTGPELSPLYGAALAHQLAAVHAATGTREMLEFGAGSGALAAAVIAELVRRDARPTHYRILERSPDLRARQQRAVAAVAAESGVHVEWLDRLPARIDGVVVMNEVLDAVAPHVVARRDGAWRERGVVLNDGALALDERPLADERLRALAVRRFPADVDYASEINPAAEALVAGVARRIGDGALLVIDYGFPQREYYHPQRDTGTLVGHYRHPVHADPLLWPGLGDLTAHVDFTAIARAAGLAGMSVAGFSTQASLLLGCGILDLLRDVGPAESLAYMRAASAVQTLVSPAEMGELFKALLLGRGAHPVPSLALTDMTHRL